MKPGLAFSLFFAIILIAGTSWYRFSNEKKVEYELVSVEKNEAMEESDRYVYQYQDFVDDFFDPADQKPATHKPLTKTDEISRGFVSDYLSLSSQGEATDANITSLMNSYYENIAKLITQESITIKEIRVVPDSRSSMQNYATQMTAIYTDYANTIDNAGQKVDQSNTKSQFIFASTFGKAKRDAVNRFKTVPTPNSLATLQVDLINTYLAGAIAMESIAKGDQDPAIALAGFAALKQNKEKEVDITGQMEKILTANGI